MIKEVIVLYVLTLFGMLRKDEEANMTHRKCMID